MPLINVKLIEDVFTSEQKGQIVERLTDAMVSIEGENMRGVTWVVVEEVRSGELEVDDGRAQQVAERRHAKNEQAAKRQASPEARSQPRPRAGLRPGDAAGRLAARPGGC